MLAVTRSAAHLPPQLDRKRSVPAGERTESCPPDILTETMARLVGYRSVERVVDLSPHSGVQGMNRAKSQIDGPIGWASSSDERGHSLRGDTDVDRKQSLQQDDSSTHRSFAVGAPRAHLVLCPCPRGSQVPGGGDELARPSRTGNDVGNVPGWARGFDRFSCVACIGRSEDDCSSEPNPGRSRRPAYSKEHTIWICA